MHLLITRPGEDGTRLAEAVRALGHDPIVEPLINIRFFEGPSVDLTDVQAILVTSANGARAIAGRTNRRDLPLFAVGEATAEAARAAGFSDVVSADGDVAALGDLVAARLDPAKGPLVHAAASDVAGDLAGRLGAAGFTVRREVLYESEPTSSLSASVVAAIKEERLDAVLLYSPRTASTLARLIRKARLVRDCRRIDLVCLSPAVAAAANDVAWHGVRIASEPKQEAILALVRSLGETPGTGASALPNSGGGPGAGAPRARRKGRGLLAPIGGTLIAVCVLGVAAWAGEPYWRPHAERYLPFLAAAKSADDAAMQRIAASEQRLKALEARVAAAEQRPSAEAAVAPLAARIEKLEAALDAVRQSVAQLASQAAAPGTGAMDEATVREALRQIAERIESVSAESSVRTDRLAREMQVLERAIPSREDAETVRAARIVFAIGRLRDAVASTHPYRVELAALRALAENDTAIAQALDRLAPNADRGVPGADALRQKFRALSFDIVSAGREPAGDGWIERTLARVLGAVNVRRIDRKEGSDTEAIVARAEDALARGDFRQAAGDLAALQGRAAEVAKPWLADADAYLAASGALADLQARAFAELGAKRSN